MLSLSLLVHIDALMRVLTDTLTCSHTQVIAGTPAELLASLPGTMDAEKLRAAVDAILQLGRAADELRAHNHALSQDLVRVTQQQAEQQEQQQQQLQLQQQELEKEQSRQREQQWQHSAGEKVIVGWRMQLLFLSVHGPMPLFFAVIHLHTHLPFLLLHRCCVPLGSPV